MTTRLHFICHASTSAISRDAFPDDEPLDERGLREARTLAAGLPGATSAVRGPSLRCAQTAEALGLDARTDPALDDCDLGRWRGRTLADVYADEPGAVRAWTSAPAAAPHGGESVLDVIARVGAWLEGLPGERIIAVTHAAVVRAAVVHVLRAPASAFWSVDAEPLALVSLTGHEGRWRLRVG
jgi:broad specificity phosphatase PhoE